MKLGFLGKATVLYAIGNVCLRAASFLLIPIYAHFLSVEDYGLLMTLMLSIQFMLVAMNCGTEHCVVRFAEHCQKTDRLNSLMGTSFCISMVSSFAVSCICLTLLIHFFQHVLHREDVYWLVTFTLCSALFQSLCDLLNAHYRSQHQPIKYAMVGISTALMLTVMSFVFLYILGMGVKGALMAKVITYGCIFSVIARQIYSRTGFRISFGMVPQLLRFGVPLSISAFGQFAITGASIYLISFHSGLDSVAVYSLGQKLASVLLMVLVLPFQLSFQPFVFSQLDTPDINKQMARLLTYLMWAIAGGAFSILLATRLFLALVMPPEFADAYRVTLLMMPAMAFVGLFYFAETLLKAVQKSSVIGLFVLVAALCSVILNYVLIERFSWYGALIASNVIYFILAGSLLTVGLKSFPLPIEWKRLRTTAFLFIGILAVNLFLLKSNLYLYCTVQLIVAAALGFAVFRTPLLEKSEKDALKQTILRMGDRFRRIPHQKPQEMSYESPSGTP